MPPRSKSSSGESNVFLVVALVLFVLSTIGLGVYAYQTNEQLAGEVAKAKKAEDDKAVAEGQRKDAEQESLMYQTALGLFKPRPVGGAGAAEPAPAPAGGEESDKKKDDGFVPSGAIYDRDKAKKVYDRIMEKLAERYKEAVANAGPDFNPPAEANPNEKAPPKFVLDWNFPARGGVDAPRISLIDSTIAAMVDQQRLRKKTADEIASLRSQQQDAAALAAAAEKDKKTFKDAAAELPREIEKAKTQSKKEYDDQVAAFTDTAKQGRDSTEKSAKEAADAKLEASKMKTRLELVDRRLADLIDKQLELIDPFQFDKPQGRILRRYSDSLVDIDLGTSDKLRPGIAFSVFPSDTLIRGMQPRMRPFRGADGKIAYRPIPKGKLEVIEVIGPNIAQCRIIDEDNAVRDRIIPGDLLYNALWRKGVSERVALFGIFDLDGDGRDDMQNMIAGLRRVGVTVDAYYDLATHKWEGEITSQTNFGVEGFYPTMSASDGNREEKKSVLDDINKARDMAKQSGLMILKPRDFFPRVGFNARLDIPADAINQAATGFGRLAAPKPEAPKN